MRNSSFSVKKSDVYSTSQNSKSKVSVSKIIKNSITNLSMNQNNTILPNKSSVSFASTREIL